MILLFRFLAGILVLLYHGVLGVYEEVFVMEGSVTLNTGLKKQQPEDIKWYFNGIRIAQLNADHSFICTDVQCNEGTERFRDRLKLDNQTGALTILNIRNTHSGLYHLLVNVDEKKIFNVTVHDSVVDDQADDLNEVIKNEGESVTFNLGVRRGTHDMLIWYIDDILITEITGSLICTDVPCKERFTDRLKLDNESGSLTIINIKYTDSGDYTLKIFSSDEHFSITREKTFSLTVVSLSRLPEVTKPTIVVLVVLIAASTISVVALICRRCQRNAGAAAQYEYDADGPIVKFL